MKYEEVFSKVPIRDLHGEPNIWKEFRGEITSFNEKKQELGSLDLVFNVLINDVFKGKRYFDFGISNENQGLYINSGLLSWKMSFGAQPIVHDHYIIDTNNYSLLESVLI